MNNTRIQVFALECPKLERQNQLQLEIAQETAKTAPDPRGADPAYAELESIRRALDTCRNSRTQSQAILGRTRRSSWRACNRRYFEFDRHAAPSVQNLLNRRLLPRC